MTINFVTAEDHLDTIEETITELLAEADEPMTLLGAICEARREDRLLIQDLESGGFLDAANEVRKAWQEFTNSIAGISL